MRPRTRPPTHAARRALSAAALGGEPGGALPRRVRAGGECGAFNVRSASLVELSAPHTNRVGRAVHPA